MRSAACLVFAAACSISITCTTSPRVPADAAPKAAPALGFSPGLLDTLIAIAGAPAAMIVTPIPHPYLGMYHALTDSIALSPILAWSPRHRPSERVDRDTRVAPDWVLAHEFGHRYDAMLRHRPCADWMVNANRISADNPYANQDAQERWAEAFANAIDYLRYTGKFKKHDMESLIQREWFVPGTFQVVRVLLQHPIYRRHPLARGERRRK